MAAEASRDTHTDANVAPTHSTSTATKINYPDNAGTEQTKDQYKTEMLSANPEILFADCDKTGKVTNLIFFTNNYTAWHEATRQHYDPNTSTSSNKHSKKIDINRDDQKTTITFYVTGKVVINANWKPFENDFPIIKASAQTKPLKQIEQQTKSPSTEPNWLAEMKEMKDKISLLEVWQIQVQEEVRQNKPSPDSTHIDKEINLAAAIKKVENSAALESKKLKDEIKRVEERSAQEKRQLEKQLETLKLSLTQERGQLENQVKDLTEQVRQLTSKLNEDRIQIRDQIREDSEEETEGGEDEISSQTSPILDPEGTQVVPVTTLPSPPVSQENLPVQTSQIVLLMDSNGKHVDGEKLFPNHTVNQQKCPNTRRAIEWLTEENLGSPSHIIIHTGTNNLRTQRGHEVVDNVKKVIDKATSKFPAATITISALLPRGDLYDYPGYIQRINAGISSYCERKPNVYFATHPTLDEDSLWDTVHLRKALVPVFAKRLKDVAFARKVKQGNSGAPRYNTPRGPHPAPRHQPAGYRAQPCTPRASSNNRTPQSTYAPSSTQAPPPTTQRPHTRFQPTHNTQPLNFPPLSYAQVTEYGTPSSSPSNMLNELHHMLSNVFTHIMVQANTGM